MRSFVVLVGLCLLSGGVPSVLRQAFLVAFYRLTVACMVLNAPLVVGFRGFVYTLWGFLRFSARFLGLPFIGLLLHVWFLRCHWL